MTSDPFGNWSRGTDARVRVLDPSSASFVGRRPEATLYIADELLVRTAVLGFDDVLATLNDTAASLGVYVTVDSLWGGRTGSIEGLDNLRVDEPDEPRRERARSIDGDGLGELADAVLTSTLVLSASEDDRVATAPDAWEFLVRYRRKRNAETEVTLHHVYSAAMPIVGNPYMRSVSGNPYMRSVSGNPYMRSADPAAEYGIPGLGGRTPIAWTGPAPLRAPDSRRRPVVAILDTGAGEHPWLPGDVVTRAPDLVFSSGLEIPIGSHDADTDPEIKGSLSNPLIGTLDAASGHGTFVSGLVRQHGPNASILAVRVMNSEGFVSGKDLLDALAALLFRHRIAVASGIPQYAIDVVSLSLGYYHEDPDAIDLDPPLQSVLTALGREGIAVVCSMGNDSTSRPLFPAALAPGGPVPTPAGCVPITSVAAQNPDGVSTAYFSNDGEWLSTRRPGASVVSTFPVTFQGTSSAAAELPGGASIADELRATIDPDNFAGGFGLWSGTSFASPIVAGEIAEALWNDEGTDDLDSGSRVERLASILASVIG